MYNIYKKFLYINIQKKIYIYIWPCAIKKGPSAIRFRGDLGWGTLKIVRISLEKLGPKRDLKQNIRGAFVNVLWLLAQRILFSFFVWGVGARTAIQIRGSI